MLHDTDIALGEVLILRHFEDGSIIEPASQNDRNREMLKRGISLSDIIIPQTEAKSVTQLSLSWEG